MTQIRDLSKAVENLADCVADLEDVGRSLKKGQWDAPNSDPRGGWLSRAWKRKLPFSLLRRSQREELVRLRAMEIASCRARYNEILRRNMLRRPLLVRNDLGKR